MTRSLLIAALLAVSAMSAQAQDMMTQDADGDGSYSMDELRTAYPDLNDETFNAADIDGNGKVDVEELAAATEDGMFEE